MLRVGYPAILATELFSDFPQGVELIPLPDTLDHNIDIDVWIPDPYRHESGKNLAVAARSAPGALADGRHGVDSRSGGTPRDHLQRSRLAQYLHRGVDPKCDPGHAEVLSLLSRCSTRRPVEAPFRGQRAIRRHHWRQAPAVSARNAGGTDRQDGAAHGGYGAIGKEIERMLAPFHVEMIRVARSARTNPRSMP
jgi:hypothetical protein